ncbi:MULTISPECIES: hypothetical protein [unclassified Streptomyces]|uniref:hypothetical protein n=1 Tax=unclassified Streptomyces TaxID=2593676 RepID=UPI00081ED362|nr:MULTISPECIES: hypothetical protein [unclassified Streptomyces]MYZ35926.1 hypothetical protein [Streptomyces sp. SID4917]SCF79487.1 hypothetical protein GA0115259_102683 [Streptomyces sp. MnatMP-M17]
MICPHCNQNLLYKERPDRTCSKCHRRFALDPKTNSLGLSDIRIHRLTSKLTDGGQLKITLDQLGAAALRKHRKSSESGIATAIGCTAIGVPVGVGLLAIGSIADDNASFTTFLGIVLLFFVVVTVVSNLRSGRRRPTDTRMSAFRSALLTDWKQQYHSLPQGVVDAVPRQGAGANRPEGARIALLCPEPAVLTFLAANDIPERYGIALAAESRQLPDTLPVLVLHDASAAGCRLVVRTREELPGRRVIDAGLPPRAVMNVKDAPTVRVARPARDLIAWLAESSTLTKDELDWLAKGWTVPLIGVRPARLIDAVTRTAHRVATMNEADPVRRRAEALGFLTWPGGSGGEAAR